MQHATRVDDVIKWKLFPRYWPFARWIHRSPVNSPHKGQGHGALMFSLIWAWMNKPLSKQLWGWWFETPSRSLWRHCNDVFHQNRPYLHVLVVSTGQPLIRSVILCSCISNIQENDIKWYMVMYCSLIAAHKRFLSIHRLWSDTAYALNRRLLRNNRVNAQDRGKPY